MNKNEYFEELMRVLAKENIQVAEQNHDILNVLLNGKSLADVDVLGCVTKKIGYLDTSEANDLYHSVVANATLVYEYINIIEKSPQLIVEGLTSKYNLLGKYNGIVLGGLKLDGNKGYNFTVWQCDINGDGLNFGHYYGNDYIAAKEEFAKQSGLVNSNRLFTDDELTEIHRCISDTLDSEYEMMSKTEKLLRDIQKKLEIAVPDLFERINKTNKQLNETLMQGMNTCM